jgi:hypothetical protein
MQVLGTAQRWARLKYPRDAVGVRVAATRDQSQPD